jgi:hypothetical protein
MGIANEVITRFILMWACCGMIWSGGVMMWWVSYSRQVLSFLSRGKSYPTAFLYGPWCLSGPTNFLCLLFQIIKDDKGSLFRIFSVNIYVTMSSTYVGMLRINPCSICI